MIRIVKTPEYPRNKSHKLGFELLIYEIPGCVLVYPVQHQKKKEKKGNAHFYNLPPIFMEYITQTLAQMKL